MKSITFYVGYIRLVEENAITIVLANLILFHARIVTQTNISFHLHLNVYKSDEVNTA